MRIGELIEQLQKVQAQYGDLQIRTFDAYESISDVGEVTVRVNDNDAPSWATDSDLGSGELYVAI